MIVMAGDKKALAADKVLDVNLVITRRCNYTCSYCTVYDNDKGFFPWFESLYNRGQALHLQPKTGVRPYISHIPLRRVENELAP